MYPKANGWTGYVIPQNISARKHDLPQQRTMSTNTKIYVDNLALNTTENELTELFSAYGNVVGVNIAFDADRKSRGFACVTMVTPEGTRIAIHDLNGKKFGAATLTVTEWWSSRPANSTKKQGAGRNFGKLN